MNIQTGWRDPNLRQKFRMRLITLGAEDVILQENGIPLIQETDSYLLLETSEDS